MSATDNSYDRVPYKSLPFRQTHPDRLATIGRLLGLRSANVEHCRVLELGCASGGNLIPMAAAFPESTFVGLDSSGRQIEDGQRAIRELELTNIKLRHQDIREFGSDAEPFDYIVSHGVFSWVSNDVQQRLLQISSECLAPNGIAYVSYNTYPGWHMRGMIRDIMLYRAKFFETPETKLSQARELLSFLTKSVRADNNPYGLLLRHELETIQRADDSYLMHDHMEEINTPIYFHEFAERADSVGLRYLGEADYGSMSLKNFPDQVRSMLRSVSQDIVEIEQYMDFVRNRAFRQTLLCHREQPISHEPDLSALAQLRVASGAVSENEHVALRAGVDVSFRFQGAHLTTNDPVVKAALIRLREVWPRSIPFAELAASALSLAAGQPVAVESDVVSPQLRSLAGALHRGFEIGLVELTTIAPCGTTMVSDRPCAAKLARWQAAHFHQVTNLRHEIVPVNDLQRRLLRQLDGSRDVSGISDSLAACVARGELVFDQQSNRSETELSTVFRSRIPQLLQDFAKRSLLIG